MPLTGTASPAAHVGVGRCRSGRCSAAPRAGTLAGTPNSVAQLVGPVEPRRCRRASCGSRSTGRSRARRRRDRRSAARAASVSTVPNARSASAVDAALGEQPLELGRGEVGVEHQAGAARGSAARGPASRSSSQRAAVRRSCQTIARWQGIAGARGPTRPTVSRWFVMPMRGDRLAGAAVAARPRRGWRRSRPRSRRRRARPSPAAGSAAGTRGTRQVRSCPCSSIASVRTPVVPASIASDDRHSASGCGAVAAAPRSPATSVGDRAAPPVAAGGTRARASLAAE